MKIILSKLYNQQSKRLIKKYPSLAKEIPIALELLQKNLLEGFTSMGKGFYKVRVPIASKGVGKRGGARIIVYIRIIEDQSFLVAMYDKAEFSDISDDVLKAFLRDI